MALSPEPPLGLRHEPAAKLTMPANPHLHLGQVCDHFSRNTAFENSIF